MTFFGKSKGYLKHEISKTKSKSKSSSGRTLSQILTPKGMKMPFGPHKGKTVKSLSVDNAIKTLDWMGAQILSAERYRYKSDPALVAELMKVILGSNWRKGLLCKVLVLIAEYKLNHSDFDTKTFRIWFGKDPHRRLRLLGLGVEFFERMRIREEEYLESQKALAVIQSDND